MVRQRGKRKSSSQVPTTLTSLSRDLKRSIPRMPYSGLTEQCFCIRLSISANNGRCDGGVGITLFNNHHTCKMDQRGKEGIDQKRAQNQAVERGKQVVRDSNILGDRKKEVAGHRWIS